METDLLAACWPQIAAAYDEISIMIMSEEQQHADQEEQEFPLLIWSLKKMLGRRNTVEDRRTPIQVQSAGQYSKGMDTFKNLSHKDLSKKKVIIFKLRKKFNIPHIASNEPGQVPHESTSITRTIITRSAGSALPRKRRSQSAGGRVLEKSNSSSENSRLKSKRAKRAEVYERFMDEYRKLQSNRLDDLSLPKLE